MLKSLAAAFFVLALSWPSPLHAAILHESPLKIDTLVVTSLPDRITRPLDDTGAISFSGTVRIAANPVEAVVRNLYCYSSTTRPKCLAVVEFTDTTLYLTRKSFPDAEYLNGIEGFDKIAEAGLTSLLAGRESDLKEIRLYFADRSDRTESLWSMLFWPAYVGAAAVVETVIPGPVSWGRFGLVSLGAWLATTGVIALNWDPAPTLTITRIRFQSGGADSLTFPQNERTLMRSWEEKPARMKPYQGSMISRPPASRLRPRK